MKGLAAVAAAVLVGVVALQDTSAGAATKAPRVSTSGSTGSASFGGGITCTFSGTSLTKVGVKAPKVAARMAYTAQKVDLVEQLQVLKKGAWKTVATKHHTSTAHHAAATLPTLSSFTRSSGVTASLRSLRVVEVVRWLRPTDGKQEGQAKVTLSTTCTPASPSPSATPTSVMPSMPGMTMDPTAPGSPAPTTSAPSPAPSPTGPVIHISSFTFGTPSQDIHAGDTVTVINDDGFAHTFTSDVAGKFDTGQIPGNGGSETFVAPAAGTYAVHCQNHASMHGSITVS